MPKQGLGIDRRTNPILEPLGDQASQVTRDLRGGAENPALGLEQARGETQRDPVVSAVVGKLRFCGEGKSRVVTVACVDSVAERHPGEAAGEGAGDGDFDGGLTVRGPDQWRTQPDPAQTAQGSVCLRLSRQPGKDEKSPCRMGEDSDGSDLERGEEFSEKGSGFLHGGHVAADAVRASVAGPVKSHGSYSGLPKESCGPSVAGAVVPETVDDEGGRSRVREPHRSPLAYQDLASEDGRSEDSGAGWRVDHGKGSVHLENIPVADAVARAYFRGPLLFRGKRAVSSGVEHHLDTVGVTGSNPVSRTILSMAIFYESPVCLAVLNPKGRDPFLDYAKGPECYDSNIHAPINFHAFAAATYGAFFDSAEAVLASRDRFDAVLVLIRRRTWISLAAVRKLKRAGMRVIVAWKECSHNQISRQLSSPRAVRAYGELLEEADGILSPTLAWPPRVGAIRQEDFWRKLKFIPTPYPVDLPAWDFSTDLEQREGILIGTREFKTEARNHIHAITRAASLAHEFDVSRVTVINSDKAHGLSILRELERTFPPGCLQILEKTLPYPEYMKLLSSHRFIYQMDRSTVPGQVAGDCLLARTICAGGSSTIEKMAFPDFSDDGTIRMKNVFERIEHILHDDVEYLTAIHKSQKIASKSLSFESAARQLGAWPIVTGKE